MSTIKRSNYIDDIEILRAFAILLVLFHHLKGMLLFLHIPYTGEIYTYVAGSRGVDLFFVISGFVIARGLLPRLQETTASQAFFQQSITFWIRRFWRLAHSAWLWLIIPTILAIAFNQSGAFGTLKGNIAGLAAGFLNIYNLYFANVFKDVEYANSTFVHWTLSLEVQFYFVLPFIIFLARKRLPLVLFILVILQLIIFSKQWMIVLRTDGFFIGVLIAIWQQQHASYHDFKPAFLLHTGARFLFISWLLGGLMVMSAKPYLCPGPYRLSIAAVISGIGVLAASYDQNCFVRTKWLKTVLLWVGSRSYAIYLIHIPVFYFMEEVYHRYFPDVRQHGQWLLLSIICCISCIILTCIISELNFRFIEEPFRKKGRMVARNYFDSRNQ